MNAELKGLAKTHHWDGYTLCSCRKEKWDTDANNRFEFENKQKTAYAEHLIELVLAAAAQAAAPPTLASEQIKYMVNRFLAWRLPENFNPDGGISFKPYFNEHTAHPMKAEPVGTNLFDAAQAEEMIRYLIQSLPAAHPPALSLEMEKRVREFLTDLSNASTYKSHDLGFEDSITFQWKDDAKDLLAALASTPSSEPAGSASQKEGKP